MLFKMPEPVIVEEFVQLPVSERTRNPPIVNRVVESMYFGK